MEWISNNMLMIFLKTAEHILISMTALGLGAAVSIPLGILVSRSQKISQLLLSIASVFQTIPSLALLAIMVPLLGVGKLPAVIALVIYSLLPILRNTILGMRAVDQNVLDASYGIGMSYTQSLWKVQIPLAMPIIISGISLSAVYVVSWTTIASFIGAGGLGDLIFMGLNNYNFGAIVGGTVPVTLLALFFDYIINRLGKRLEPVTSSIR